MGDDQPRPAWAEQLRRHRLARNWSQAEVVAALRSRTRTSLPAGLVDQWKRWERGRSRPDEFYRPLIAAVFDVPAGSLFPPSRPSLGLGAAPDGDAGSVRQVEYSSAVSDAVESLEQLSGADLADDGSTRALQWSDTATADTITRHLFSPVGSDPAIPSVDPLAPATAASIRATAAHLMALDFAYGGGHVRNMLLLYFQQQVVPILRSPAASADRKELFSAAAEVTQLLGWSAYDAGLHGAAQRYFTAGLRLTREADDAMLGSRLLSNLSHQANYLGRHVDATHYARAAQSAGQARCTPTVMAMLLAMEARALAGSGDARACAAVLHRAETLFEARAEGADPEWISYFTREELAGELAHCFRDLGQAEHTRLYAAHAITLEDTPTRTRAFIGMVDAVGALHAGQVDESVALAVTSVEMAGPLQSRRYVRYLTDFHEALTADTRRAALAADLVERVRRLRPDFRLVPQAG